MPSTTTSSSTREATATPIRQNENERLQRRADDLAQQVLQARDTVIGAEAELGVVLARVAELERQVQVRDVEIRELRAFLARSGRRAEAVDAAVAAGDRLARGVIARARSPRT